MYLYSVRKVFTVNTHSWATRFLGQTLSGSSRQTHRFRTTNPLKRGGFGRGVAPRASRRARI